MEDIEVKTRKNLKRGIKRTRSNTSEPESTPKKPKESPPRSTEEISDQPLLPPSEVSTNLSVSSKQTIPRTTPVIDLIRKKISWNKILPFFELKRVLELRLVCHRSNKHVLKYIRKTLLKKLWIRPKIHGWKKKEGVEIQKPPFFFQYVTKLNIIDVKCTRKMLFTVLDPRKSWPNSGSITELKYNGKYYSNKLKLSPIISSIFRNVTNLFITNRCDPELKYLDKLQKLQFCNLFIPQLGELIPKSVINIKFSSVTWKDGEDYFGKLFQNIQGLVDLDFNTCSIPRITKLLDIKKLQTLRVKNILHNESRKYLGNLLRCCVSIVTLDLEDTQLSERKIASMMKLLPNLELLSLKNNRLIKKIDFAIWFPKGRSERIELNLQGCKFVKPLNLNVDTLDISFDRDLVDSYEESIPNLYTSVILGRGEPGMMNITRNSRKNKNKK